MKYICNKANKGTGIVLPSLLALVPILVAMACVLNTIFDLLKQKIALLENKREQEKERLILCKQLLTTPEETKQTKQVEIAHARLMQWAFCKSKQTTNFRYFWICCRLLDRI
mmetsp:Transcript_1217/g.2490  ORF Transcript_1217/g.2490 Transcript_1217/m.2490 type:complete len:112 (+) Transcript_1217:1882-2217(+)